MSADMVTLRWGQYRRRVANDPCHPDRLLRIDAKLRLEVYRHYRFCRRNMHLSAGNARTFIIGSFALDILAREQVLYERAKRIRKGGIRFE